MKTTSPEEGGHKAVCQQGHWALKGADWGSHIDWKRERVPVRTLGSEGVDCEIPRRLERGTKHSL